MRTFDAGTMGGDTGFSYRFVMLFVTMGGIFVVSSLIGVLSVGVEGKPEELAQRCKIAFALFFFTALDILETTWTLKHLTYSNFPKC